MAFDSSKPYIFFSYAHKNSELGLQIIKQMQKNKFNLWYDEGIEVGTEYSDYIAEHIEQCAVFMCLMDENYIESRYCRDEIDYAINRKGIDILIVNTKEIRDFNMPAGLKMRTARYQAVFLNRFPNIDKFMDSLLKSDILSPCNMALVKAKEKPALIVYPENGFNPTYQQKKKAEKIVDTYALFGVRIEAFTGVAEGPRVTRFEFRPAEGQKFSKIIDLTDDVSLALGVGHVRILGPMHGKLSFGIEVPNEAPETVEFEEVFSSDAFKNSGNKMNVVLGKNVDGTHRVIDLSRMPHLLIGGQFLAGKTNLLHCMILSLIRNTSPEDVKLLLMSPQGSDFGVYGNAKHLYMPVLTDEKVCLATMNKLVEEMTRRIELFSKCGVRDITAYNQTSNEPLYRIAVFADEMSLLAEQSFRDFETSISRLAQGGRPTGIYLVLATGKITNDVITGILKASIPSRIALSVSTATESRMIIDTRGAEKLMMKGDMLFHPIGEPKPVRVQSAYVDLDKIAEMIAFDCVDKKAGGKKNEDMEKAVEIAVQYGAISSSLLEQRMQINHQKALRIIRKLDEAGYLEPSEGRGKPRKLKNK